MNKITKSFPVKCYGTVCLNTFELEERSGKCYGTVCLNTFELKKDQVNVTVRCV